MTMKILHLDIETAPNLAYVWGLFKENIGINQIEAAGYVMCWAAKWDCDRTVHFNSLHKSNGKEMLEEVHALIDEADVVVHHNGKKFDMPTLNKEFLLHDMKPPSPYREVDTLTVARSRFRFPSNKLDYIAQALDLGNKVKHEGFELWLKCMKGEKTAWKKMERYNKHDVRLLEQVYHKMLPWVKNHPNWGIYLDNNRPSCINCGGDKLWKRGFAHTQANRWQRYQCKDCGSWCRSPASDTTKDQRAKVMRQATG